MTNPMMTCDEFQALLPDYLEEGARATAVGGRTDAQSRDRMDAPLRDRADAHRLDCAECAALVADLRAIVQQAGDLPLLEPAHDLWSGIETRIAADVVALPVAGRVAETVPAMHPARPVVHRTWTTRRLAIAASLLVMATAGITWTVASRRPVLVIPATPAATAAPTVTPVSAIASKPSMDETYGREIAALRKIVDERRAELDSGTIGVLEKNLLVIDKAIRESRAALAKDPASTFLNDRLSSAYDTKLQLLRAVATIPAHT